MSCIELKNEVAKLVINPKMGGSILHYSAMINGKFRDVFRNANDVNSIHDSASFPLVPFSNRIKKGQFNWQQKQIILPLNHLPEKHVIHGHGWQTQWQVISHCGSEVTLEYKHKADAWPFSYVVRQRFKLIDTRLKMSMTLTNLSAENMPAGLGFHPYFTRTQKCALHTNISHMWAVDNECMPTQITDAPEAFKYKQGLIINDVVLDNALINFPYQAEIYWPEWQAKADITTSNNCDFLVVYSPDKSDFVCVEPVTHCTDAINMAAMGEKNTGVKSLSPHEEMHIWMIISPKSLIKGI